jgi:hypothetical protein
VWNYDWQNATIRTKIENMNITELLSLSLREKLQILELIWKDLGEQIDESEVSPTVRSLLDQRLERIQNGSVEVQDWDAVKFEIGQK